MTIEFLDHTADVALRASGETLEEAFEEAARGEFSVMVDVDKVRPRERHAVHVEAATHTELLVAWLSDLLVQKDLSGLVFSEFAVGIRPTEDGFVLEGAAVGEKLDVSRHRPGCEVKGISLLGLMVQKVDDGWVTQCVFDV